MRTRITVRVTVLVGARNPYVLFYVLFIIIYTLWFLCFVRLAILLIVMVLEASISNNESQACYFTLSECYNVSPAENICLIAYMAMQRFSIGFISKKPAITQPLQILIS